jgi:hypothetical protein
VNGRDIYDAIRMMNETQLRAAAAEAGISTSGKLLGYIGNELANKQLQERWIATLKSENKLKEKAKARGINIKSKTEKQIITELLNKKWFNNLTIMEKAAEYENFLRLYKTPEENLAEAQKAGIDVRKLNPDEIRKVLARKKFDSSRSAVQYLISSFTSKKNATNGTSRGSQARALLKGTIGAITGLGNTAPVLWDFKRQKFRVSVNPGPGYENYEIIGSNAAELASDYKIKDAMKAHVGRSTLGSVANTIKGAFSGLTGFFTKKAPAGGKRKTLRRRR